MSEEQTTQIKQPKAGDRVRMKYDGSYVHGEITIVRKNEGFIRSAPNDAIICKVLFDEEWAPDYWYYLSSELEPEGR